MSCAIDDLVMFESADIRWRAETLGLSGVNVGGSEIEKVDDKDMGFQPFEDQTQKRR